MIKIKITGIKIRNNKELLQAMPRMAPGVQSHFQTELTQCLRDAGTFKVKDDAMLGYVQRLWVAARKDAVAPESRYDSRRRQMVGGMSGQDKAAFASVADTLKRVLTAHGIDVQHTSETYAVNTAKGDGHWYH